MYLPESEFGWWATLQRGAKCYLKLQIRKLPYIHLYCPHGTAGPFGPWAPCWAPVPWALGPLGPGPSQGGKGFGFSAGKVLVVAKVLAFRLARFWQAFVPFDFRDAKCNLFIPMTMFFLQ